MTTQSMTRRGGGGNYVQRSSSSGLYDVLELILDKGLVIDIFVRVSLVGIEILTIDARIVIASVDTYLRFAEAVNRLDLEAKDDSKGLPQMMEDLTSGGASSKTKGAIDGPRVRAEGVAGGPVALVAGDGLAALTSDVPGMELRSGREELTTHAR